MALTLRSIEDGRRIYAVPISKCYGAEIIKRTDGMTSAQYGAILDKWVIESALKIYTETGVKVSPDELLIELSDAEWIFHIAVDDEEANIDIESARRQIDVITKRTIDLIKSEEEDGE